MTDEKSRGILDSHTEQLSRKKERLMWLLILNLLFGGLLWGIVIALAEKLWK